MHLEVDLAVLTNAADNLRHAVGVAREVAEGHDRLTSLVDDYGSDEVGEAAGDFVRSWGYGMRLVADDADTLAAMLAAGAAAYQGVEGSITEALE